jgi:hypothetical protein
MGHIYQVGRPGSNIGLAERGEREPYQSPALARAGPGDTKKSRASNVRARAYSASAAAICGGVKRIEPRKKLVLGAATPVRAPARPPFCKVRLQLSARVQPGQERHEILQ